MGVAEAERTDPSEACGLAFGSTLERQVEPPAIAPGRRHGNLPMRHKTIDLFYLDARRHANQARGENDAFAPGTKRR
jgi:hypothetical protein